MKSSEFEKVMFFDGEWYRCVPISTFETKKENILAACSFFTGVGVEDAKVVTRKEEVVLVRQIMMYMLRKFTGMSLVEIGGEFGNKDHSTVTHSISTIKDRYDTDHEIKSLMTNIEGLIISKQSRQ
jgi:chromosomal replication initiation ATPase DnaA